MEAPAKTSTETQPKSGPIGPDDVIVVEDVAKIYDGRRVLDGLNFRVKRGEILVIMGGSGCGKSTVLRQLIGLQQPEEGRIWIDGSEITRLTEEAFINVRRRFGVLFQSGALFNSMTVGDNVALPIREHYPNQPEMTVDIMVKMKLSLVGMTQFSHLKPAEISGGMKKRAALARALALDPKLLFCDEPTAGLDPTRVTEFDELTLKLCRDLGVTAVVVTHDMTSAFRIGTRMILLNKGKIWAVGTPAEIRAHPDPGVKRFINGDPESEVRQDADSYLQDILGESK
ncbi:MAG: ATP-binding cassette domain-containing protein [Verrucomicrobia bacterium]|nr:ATP-binding cassette domain-containing protein [Verrucomicrobiota bacterium]